MVDRRQSLCPAFMDELKAAGLITNDISVLPVKGGHINQCFRLKDIDNDYFLKVFVSDDALECDRLQSFQIQKQVAAKGIAPEPLYLSTEAGFQVERWVDVTPLGGVNNDAQIALLANTLATLHCLDIHAPALDLSRQWRSYLSVVGSDNEWMDKIERCEQVLAETDNLEDRVFCHNDLSFSHVTGQGLVFDWEYAALGSRYFDIASCSAVNQLDCTQHNRLIQHYSEETGVNVQFLAEQVARYADVVSLTNSLWHEAIKK